ncbi:hypothetical protein [uncultured Nostoc sp.]|uniref:hypothetical protein n=1 Tax=uncultured Nostoc sp. TaxID=340711 RepID=UPI0035C9EA61
MRQLLDEKAPQQHWGGLKNVLTPEGHYLWLCEHHAAEYSCFLGKTYAGFTQVGFH